MGGKHIPLLFTNHFKIQINNMSNHTALKDNGTRYDVVRKFDSEYAMEIGKRYERVLFNLSWEDAETEKNNMNLYHLDDLTACFYIEQSR